MIPFKNLTHLCCGLLVVASSLSSAQTAFDIPAVASGTWQLTVPSYNGSLPFTRGSSINIVVDAAKDTVCIGGVEAQATRIANSTSTTSFDILHTGGLTFRLAFSSSGIFGSMSFTNRNLGQASFTTGSRISTATVCSASAPTLSAAETELFSLGATVYPTLLAGGTTPAIYQEYVYRYFPASGIYIAIQGTNVYTLGGVFGNTISNRGRTNDLLPALRTAKTNIEINATGDPVTLSQMSALSCALEGSIGSNTTRNGSTVRGGSFVNNSQGAVKIWWLDYTGKRTLFHTLGAGLSTPQTSDSNHLWMLTDTSDNCLGIYAISPTGSGFILTIKRVEANTNVATSWTNGVTISGGGSTGGGVASGLYTLTVSGSYRAVGTSIPLSVTIPNMPAIAVTDTAAIANVISTSFGASGVANLQVTSINNTASRITFRVEFTANLTGFGNVSWDLTYDYVK